MTERRLAVLTTGRQDYGILRSTILLLRRTSGFDVAVWAGGMHLQPRFGEPLVALRRDDVPVARELPFLAEPPDLKDALPFRNLHPELEVVAIGFL